jgi:hypothetical protein
LEVKTEPIIEGKNIVEIEKYIKEQISDFNKPYFKVKSKGFEIRKKKN